jgi:hypothetical protein
VRKSPKEKKTNVAPKVVVEELTLLLRIRGLVFKLSLETGYTDRVFCGFPSVPPVSAVKYLK